MSRLAVPVVLAQVGLMMMGVTYWIAVRRGKPLGLNTIISMLYDLEREEVVDEIEAWLLKLGYLAIVQGGRVLTGTGQRYVMNMIEDREDREGRVDGRVAAAGGR